MGSRYIYNGLVVFGHDPLAEDVDDERGRPDAIVVTANFPSEAILLSRLALHGREPDKATDTLHTQPNQGEA